MNEKQQIIDFWADREFEKELGEGPYGEVYLESRLEMDEKFYSASKIIRVPDEKKHPAELLDKDRPEDVDPERWLHRIASDVNHRLSLIREMRGRDNVVFLEDFKIIKRRDGYTFYIRSELLTPLEEYLSAHEPDPDAALRFCVDISRALSRFEKAGILHRNIKPSNIFVDGEGRFKLGDVGFPRLGLPGGEFAAPGSENGPGSISDEIYSVCAVAKKLFPLSGRIASVCERGASPDESRRFRTLEQFQNALLRADESAALIGYESAGTVTAVEKLKKKRSAAAIVGMVILTVMIAVSAALYMRLTVLFATKTDPGAPKEESVEEIKLTADADGRLVMIDLAGKSFEQSRRMLENNGLSAQRANAYDAARDGKVISQSVRAGETVPPGAQVWLLVGTDDQRAVTRRVENIVADSAEFSVMKESEHTPAVTVLPADLAGSQLIWTSADPSVATVSEGVIAGVGVGETTVTVCDNTGLCRLVMKVKVLDNAVEVPDLNGMKDEEAKTLLEEQGFVAAVEYVYTVESEMYRVVSQDPQPGGTLPFGSEIRLTVSLGDVNDDRVAVTGISLSETAVTLNGGQSVTLEAYIDPEDATNQNVSWLSTDRNVATVSSDGVVKAVGDGQCRIRAVTADGGKSAACDVTVKITSYTVRYSPNGGSGSTPDSFHVYSVPKSLSECGFSRAGYSFAGWALTPDAELAEYGDLETVESLTDQDNGVVTLYAVWDPGTYEVYLDPNGGSVSKNTLSVTFGKKFGYIEQPVRKDFHFEGWFSNTTDGVRVDRDTVVSVDTPTTLYARWSKVSDYVPVDEVPQGARIVEGSDVWEYSVTEIRRVTESRSDPAWELIGESYDWLETDSATVEYAQFPAGFDVSSGIFKRYGELPPNEENTALRRVVYNSSEITGYIMWHWSPRFTGDPISDSPVSDRRTDECPLFTAFYTASVITGDTDPSGGVRPGLIYHNRGSDSDVSWWWYGGADLPIRTVSYTVTELKYVYEYRVTSIKESDSEPQDLENVSDVVHYVKYYLEQN